MKIGVEEGYGLVGELPLVGVYHMKKKMFHTGHHDYMRILC